MKKVAKTPKQFAAERRARQIKAGLCINGPSEGFVSKSGLVHGEPVRIGGRCQNCIDRRKTSEILNGVTTMLSIREVVEQSTHLALDNADDREALIKALEHRRARRRKPVAYPEPLRSVA